MSLNTTFRFGTAALLLLPATAASGQSARAEAALEAARAGGVSIVCRHAITDHDQREVEPVDYDDVTTQRRLSAEGERQSQALGEAFRALGIPVAEVIASPMERSYRTAELMFGRFVIDSIWHTNGSEYGGPPRERRRQVLGTPVEGGNRVIVSHIGTMGSVLPRLSDVEEGDCVVVRPLGEEYEVVGVVPWRAWGRAAGAGERGP